jgi:hypothetical protein
MPKRHRLGVVAIPIVAIALAIGVMPGAVSVPFVEAGGPAPATVDLYRTSLQTRMSVFSAWWSTVGTHTIKIRVLGPWWPAWRRPPQPWSAHSSGWADQRQISLPAWQICRARTLNTSRTWPALA